MTLFNAVQQAKTENAIISVDLTSLNGADVYDVMKRAAELYATSQYNKALEDAASKQTRLVAAEILKLKK